MNPLLITIWIALVLAGIFAILMIAVQVLIFILAENFNFNFNFNFQDRLNKFKKFIFKKFEILLNPVARIKKIKIEKI